MSNITLEIEDITKNFPGVKALDKVKFSLKEGEIHALIGENGAGKSTLMHILAGIHQPDCGWIKLNKQKINLKNPYHAAKHGIGVVFQELSLVDKLTIAENIFVNRQPLSKYGLIEKKKLYDETNKLLKLFNLNFSPSTKVKNLSTGDQQLIEILKALSQEPKVLILDEPTSSLSQDESKRLFELISELKYKGISIIYISHRMKEIFELCDRVTVLRDGMYIGTKEVLETTEDELVTMMVGRELKDVYGNQKSDIGEEYFKVKDFTSQDKFEKVGFSLSRGEILGVFGLIGAGRTELAQGIFGLDPKVKGEVYLEDKILNISRPEHAIKNGISYLTEDRKKQGLFLDMSVRENLIPTDLKRFCCYGKLNFLKKNQIKKYAEKMVEKFGIVTPSINYKVGKLSGGNQQKVLLANWMGVKPKVLIVDEPTRGVDVGAKSDIYNHLRDLASEDVGIIVMSSDLLEILGVCDRILVMREGSIVGELSAEEASEEKVMRYAAGVSSHMEG